MRKTIIAVGAASAAVVLGATVAMPLAAELERAVFPVIGEWKVTGASVSGQDVLVWGVVTKARDCTYLPPIIARDDEGRAYLVESMSPTSRATWASGVEHKFGPWRIAGAAGKRLTFTQFHRCHALWNQSTELGTVEVRQ